MDALFVDYIDRLADQLFNPQKRVFVGYLASALVLALGVRVFAARTRLLRAPARIFSARVWWSRSAKADYKIAALNQAIMMGVAPRLISQLAVATLLFEAMHVWFGGRPLVWLEAPGWAVAVVFTVVLFLLDDATKYLLHRCLHAWPLLWCFHKVHHTAETMTPFTVYRTHPVEAVLFSLRATLVQAVAMAAFFFFLGDRVELMTVFGANVILFVFNVAGSNLRHSHVWISYGRVIEHVLISPAQHQIHHSVDPRHHDRNFGTVLAIWDWMGHSLCLAEHGHEIRYGVTGAAPEPHGLKTVYLEPFREAVAGLVRTTMLETCQDVFLAEFPAAPPERYRHPRRRAGNRVRSGRVRRFVAGPQHLFAPPTVPDQPVHRGVRGADRCDDQYRLRLQGTGAAPSGGGTAEPGGRRADGRYRPSPYVRRQGPPGARRVGRSDEEHPASSARSRQPLVRLFQAGPRDRRLEKGGGRFLDQEL